MTTRLRILAIATIALCLTPGSTGTSHAIMAPETFSLPITATNGHDGVFTLGMDPAATATGDPDFDVVLPPAVPGGADVALLGTQPFPRLSTDIQAADPAGAVWRLRVTVPSGHPITLAWPAPTGAYLASRSLQLLPVGGGAEVNMKATFTLVVTTTTTYNIVVAEGGNRAPVARPDLALASGDDVDPADITIPVLDNDADPNGDVLRVASVTSPTAAGATVALGADGLSVRYTPAPGRYGDDSFSYVLTDTHAAPLTASADVIVSVSGPNWEPPPDLPNAMTVHAVARLPDGTLVGAAGSLLAAFKGSACRGTATVFDGPALPMQFQLSVGADVSSETGLTLRVYDRAAQRVYQIRHTLDFAAGTTLGLSTAPVEFTATEYAATVPAISIGDAEVVEGDAGTAWLELTLHLSRPSTVAVSVSYATVDATAMVADTDYLPASGTLTFAVGETTRALTLAILGDTRVEGDEPFTVLLSSPVNATLADGQGMVTIRNDDDPPPPEIRIADAEISEGDAGSSNLSFVVTLSASSASTVTVTYSSADGSATAAGADYAAVSGTLTFTSGQTRHTITVPVNGDTTLEPDEALTLTLSSPVKATLAMAQATGTIRNDDEASGGDGPPDWQPPSGLLNTMTVHAVVRLADGSFVSAAGGRLAAFKGGSIRGVCTLFNGPAAPMQFQLSVGSNSSSEPGLTLRVYDAAGDAIYDLEETIGFVADGTLGTITAPLEFTARSPLPALPTLSLAAASVNEGNTGSSSLSFVVTLSAASTSTVTVTYASTDGSATVAGADYVAASGTLTFTPGQTSRTITVAVTGDTAVEPDETLTLTLSSPANATLATAVATGTLRNDDSPGGGGGAPDWQPPSGLLNTMTVHAVVRLADNSFLGAAGSLLAAFQGDSIRGVCTLFNGPATPMQFQLSIGSNASSETGIRLRAYDATTGDVLDVNGSLAFTADTTMGSIVAPQEFSVGAEVPVLPTLSLADAEISEGNAGSTSLSFVVTLSASSSSTVTVNYASADGSATTANSDYAAVSDALTFTPGQTSRTIAVAVNGDTTVELDETFTLTLASPTNATLADAQATGTLRNDDSGSGDGPPDWQPPSGLLNTMTVHAVVRLADNSFISATGSMLAAFKGDTPRGVCSLFNGPATPMQFQLSVGSNGSAEAGLELKVYDAGADTVYALNEGIDFVADATLGTVVVPLEFTANAGPPPTPSLSIADVEAAEGNSGTTAFVFTVRLSPAASVAVTANYSTSDGSATVAGSDYRAASGLLTFGPGDTTKTITILVNGDTTVETREEFPVTLSSAANAVLADAQALGAILNDDSVSLPSLTVGDAMAYEGGTAAFTVILNAPASAAVTVSYATADGSATLTGNDYTAASGTLTFSPGETLKTVTVTTRTDALTETTETFFLSLSNPTNAVLAADAQGQGTLFDGAAPVLSVNDVSGAEGTAFMFTITLSRTSPTAVTVQYATADGSATATGGDYQSGSGTLTFAAGQTTRTLSVTVLADATVEADEAFRVLLSNANAVALADAEGLGTIRGSSVPWYPAFAVEPEGIVRVTLRSLDGTLVLESQAIDFDGQHTVEARHYKHGTGPGRAGLLPGQYLVQTAQWDQDAQEFVASGSLLQLPLVAYAPAPVPAPASLTATSVEGSNRNWSLGFGGTVQAQGFELEIRDALSGRLAHHLAEEFLPATTDEAFPAGPTRTELTRLLLDAAGAYQWRLRFFTPLDPPSLATEAWNWSAWKDLVTLTDASMDPARKPVVPPLAERWYYPEPGAEFSALADTDVASVDLSWSPVANADSYYLHLTTSAGRVILNRQLVQATHVDDLMLAPDTYFWALCPANRTLGMAGIADAWMEPFPFFTVLPGVSSEPDVPGAVLATTATRLPDGYVRMALAWTGRVAPTVRVLVLNPGIMLEAEEDRDAAPDSYTTEQLDLHLAPGQRTLVRVQGISATGEPGPWSAFVPITVPARP